MTVTDHAAHERVLVVGEALVDIVSDSTSPVPTEHVGGSPANVALGLARLGTATRLHTALGRDDRGRRIRDHLEASGVRIDPRSWTLPRTATAHATIAPDGAATYQFDIHWDLDAVPELDSADLIHVGSISAYLAPGAERVRELLRTQHGISTVTFDPNIRADLIGDHAAAVQTTETIAALSDVVKLSDEDASWLYPDLTVEQVLTHVHGLGPRIVAVTQGANGSTLSSGDGRVRIPAPQVRVRDTVGAGDSYTAALIHQIIHTRALLDDPSRTALATLGHFAATVAATTVQRAGADLPYAHELLP